MDLYHVGIIIGYSIAIPASIGLIRFSKINEAYRPFIYYCLLDMLNHSLSYILIEAYHSNTINSNIFVLIEAILFVVLFRNWGIFKSKPLMFYVTLAMLGLVWIIDNLVWHELGSINSFFRIVYSFILVFLSIQQMNVLIASAKKNLLYNSIFLICCGLIIYYSYKATIEVFFFIQLNASVSFYSNIFTILVLANLFVNLIFAWAVLWIPKKPKFISPH